MAMCIDEPRQQRAALYIDPLGLGQGRPFRQDGLNPAPIANDQRGKAHKFAIIAQRIAIGVDIGSICQRRRGRQQRDHQSFQHVRPPKIQRPHRAVPDITPDITRG